MGSLEGRTIVETREMSDDEFERLAIHKDIWGGPDVLVLDDGQVVFPGKDLVPNGAGAWFGVEPSEMESVEGLEIERVFPMSESDVRQHMWEDNFGYRPPVLKLSDGRFLYPSCDGEGNDSGAMLVFEGDELFTIEFQFND